MRFKDKTQKDAHELYREFYKDKYKKEYTGHCYNDACDAFRHAYGGASGTDRWGRSTTILFGNLYEWKNKVDPYTKFAEDTYHEGASNAHAKFHKADPRESDMDRANNNAGAYARERGASYQDIFNKIEDGADGFVKDLNSFPEAKHQTFAQFFKDFADRFANDPAFQAAMAWGFATAFNYYRTNSFDPFGPTWRGSTSSNHPKPEPRSGHKQGGGSGGHRETGGGTKGGTSGHGSTGGSGQDYRESGNSYRQGGGYQQSGSRGRWWERAGDWFRDTFTGSSSRSESSRQEEQRQEQRQEQRRNEYRQQYSNARPGSNSWGYGTNWQQSGFSSSSDTRSNFQNNQRGNNWGYGANWQQGFGSSSWTRFNSEQFRQQQSGQRTGSSNWGWNWGGFGSGYQQDYTFNQQRFQQNWNRAGNFFRNFRANMGGWTNRMRSHLRYARSRVSPLVLDLDDDGLKLVPPERGVYFDIDNDRFMERVGWIDKSEAHLARDLNGNGIIDNISELFGDDLVSAFFKLALLDQDQNNVLDNKDPEFKELLVWRDLNMNGFSEPDELQSIEVFGIKHILLRTTVLYEVQHNNSITESSTFRYGNGTKGTVYDVHYANDDMDSWYQESTPHARVSRAKLDEYLAQFQKNVAAALVKKLIELAKNPDTENEDWVQSVVKREAEKIIKAYTLEAERELDQLQDVPNLTLNPDQVKRQHHELLAKMQEVYRAARRGSMSAEAQERQVQGEIRKELAKIERELAEKHRKNQYDTRTNAATDLQAAKELELKRLKLKYENQQGAEEKIQTAYLAAMPRIEEASHSILALALQDLEERHQKLLKDRKQQAEAKIRQQYKKQGQSKSDAGHKDMQEEIRLARANVEKKLKAKYTQDVQTAQDQANLRETSKEALNKKLAEIWRKYQKDLKEKQAEAESQIKKKYSEERGAEDAKLNSELAEDIEAEFTSTNMNLDAAHEARRQMLGFQLLLQRIRSAKIKATRDSVADFQNIIAVRAEDLYAAFIEQVAPMLIGVQASPANQTAIPEFEALHGVFNDVFNFNFQAELDTEIDPETLEMPMMRGYGTVPSLHVAVSTKPALKKLVSRFMQLRDFSKVYPYVLEILYNWADVEDISDEQRSTIEGMNIEAKKIEVIEQVTGQPFRQLGVAKIAGQFASEDLEKAFNVVLSRIMSRLLVQGPFAGIFTNHSYDFTHDTLTLGSDIDTILTSIKAEFVNGHFTALFGVDYVLWTHVGYILAGHLDELALTIDELRAKLTHYAGIPIHVGIDDFGLTGTDDDDVIIGTPSGDTIRALKGNDVVHGGEGSDMIEGNEGNDELHGEKGIDRIYGNQGNDKLYGGNDRDFLYGNDGDDELYGDDGDDTVEGGPGADIMYGGSGTDILSYGSSQSGVVVSLKTEAASGGDAVGDAFKNFENLGGSENNDRLHGDDNDNYINGEAGNDILYGGLGNDKLFGATGQDKLYGEEGDDTLEGFEGLDHMDGGPGTDTVSYAHPFAQIGVRVNLTSGFGKGGHAEGDTYLSIENVIGSKFNDTITGNNESNVLFGHDSDDVIYGEGGDDILEGGPGNDKAFGGDGDDKIISGFGSDEIYGGAGLNTVIYKFALRAVHVNLTAGITRLSALHQDRLYNITRVIGSDFNDTLIGDNGNNVFVLGAGNNTIDGGPGIDVISCEKLGVQILVDMKQNMIRTHFIKDRFKNIENIIGTELNDFIAGDGQDNYLMGLAGDDNITGGDGNDVLAGGADKNTLAGGPGSDVFITECGSLNEINGGTGSNMLSYVK